MENPADLLISCPFFGHVFPTWHSIVLERHGSGIFLLKFHFLQMKFQHTHKQPSQESVQLWRETKPLPEAPPPLVLLKKWLAKKPPSSGILVVWRLTLWRKYNVGAPRLCLVVVLVPTTTQWHYYNSQQLKIPLYVHNFVVGCCRVLMNCGPLFMTDYSALVTQQLCGY